MKKALITLFAAATMLTAVSAVQAADVANGKGTVNKIDAETSTLNISHEAIPSIKWPAMTMDFKVADKKVLSGIKAGQVVTFGLTKEAKTGYVISHIEPAK
ncbi:MAG: copper-binding protein [Gammaproteobacteria bacterium]|nr:copper-binding protein [Gammaproteobacteria bacterium]MBU1980069.1 copper-binding protein [Gammaproteobacteria bacterium]